MKVTVVRPDELGETEVAHWRAYQARQVSLTSPFLSPEFTCAVGSVRPGTRVAVLEEGNAVVGFFPYERRGLGFGVPVGPGLNECQGVVHAPGLAWEPTELLRACGLSFWEFDCLLEGQRPFAAYEVHRVPSPVMDLGKGFDAYLAERRAASSRIRDLPRRRRRLEREVGPVRFAFDTRDPAALGKLMAWKSAQYRSTGRADRFAERWIVELLELLLDSRAPGCTGRLSVLQAGERIVAAHFGLGSTTTLPTWFPTFDTRFGPYSPGLLLHLDMALAAAESGIRFVDLGRGAKGYKEWLKSYDFTVGEGCVRRASPGGVLHWARRAPVRRFRQTVLESPALYRAADQALVRFGRVRRRSGPGNFRRSPALGPL